MKTVVTAIVPCYNEEAALPYFLREIRKVADAMSATYDLNFEFLFVNDGSARCIFSGPLQKKIPVSGTYLFHGILGKRPPCMRDLKTPLETMWR